MVRRKCHPCTIILEGTQLYRLLEAVLQTGSAAAVQRCAVDPARVGRSGTCASWMQGHPRGSRRCSLQSLKTPVLRHRRRLAQKVTVCEEEQEVGIAIGVGREVALRRSERRRRRLVLFLVRERLL